MQIEPQAFDRVLSSMCTEPHPAARDAAERFLATNPGDPGTYPNVSALEDDAIALLSEIAGLDDPAGYVTACGGTEANIQAVRIARERAESRSPNVVMPESGHFSFQKAADLLGVELRLVPTDERHRADLEAVRASVDDDTALVVGVAGTTEYGRVDPIPELGEIAASVDALLHVDAAWGGFVLPFTDYDWHFDHAAVDTMTIDPHKMGQAAVPAGIARPHSRPARRTRRRHALPRVDLPGDADWHPFGRGRRQRRRRDGRAVARRLPPPVRPLAEQRRVAR